MAFLKKPYVIIAVIIIIGVGIIVSVRGNAKKNDLGADVFNTLSQSNTNLLPCSTTNTTPQIKVISPNGNEVFTAGQQITIKWASCNIPSNAMLSIQLEHMSSLYPYLSYSTSNLSISSNDGQETITLPAAGSPIYAQNQNGVPFGKWFKVDVFTGIPAFTLDASDNLFTINAPVVATPPVQVPSQPLHQ